MKTKPPATYGLAERIAWYVDHDMEQKAYALAQLGDYLEECFSWQLTFDSPEMD